MTALTVQQCVVTGLRPTFSAANADGHYVKNDVDFIIGFKNAGTEKTVTVATPGTRDGAAVDDVTITVAATTGEKWAGPFRADVFNQSSGVVNFTWTSETGLTVAAVRLGG